MPVLEHERQPHNQPTLTLTDQDASRTGSPGTPPGVLVFGGAFDPPHRTHRRLLVAALGQLPVDRAVVLPTGRHPLKGDRIVATNAARLDLCGRAFGDLPGVTVRDTEMQRPGVAYTVDTLRDLAAEFPGRRLFFLMGSDNLHILDKWHDHHAVLELATVVTFPRTGYPIDRAVLEGQDLTAAEIHALVATSIEADTDDVSATAIRAALARGEIPPELDDRVADRIRELGLYNG